MLTVVKFTYNEPRIGTIEFDGPENTWTADNGRIIREIELSYPEAIDIEIIEVTEEID